MMTFSYQDIIKKQNNNMKHQCMIYAMIAVIDYLFQAYSKSLQAGWLQMEVKSSLF